MPYTGYVYILFDVGISVVTIYIGHHHTLVLNVKQFIRNYWYI